MLRRSSSLLWVNTSAYADENIILFFCVVDLMTDIVRWDCEDFDSVKVGNKGKNLLYLSSIEKDLNKIIGRLDTHMIKQNSSKMSCHDRLYCPTTEMYVEQSNRHEVYPEKGIVDKIIIPRFKILPVDFDFASLSDAGIIDDLLDGLKGPPYAVRSSSPYEDQDDVSFAGIFDSILDVGREDIAGAVEQVLVSAMSDKAKDYAERFDVDVDEKMAVIIQELISAPASGTYSINLPLARWDSHSKMIYTHRYSSGLTVVGGKDYRTLTLPGLPSDLRRGDVYSNSKCIDINLWNALADCMRKINSDWNQSNKGNAGSSSPIQCEFFTLDMHFSTRPLCIVQVRPLTGFDKSITMGDVCFPDSAPLAETYQVNMVGEFEGPVILIEDFDYSQSSRARTFSSS